VSTPASPADPGLRGPLWIQEAAVTWPVAGFPRDPPTL
jgi:hypothetical protein